MGITFVLRHTLRTGVSIIVTIKEGVASTKHHNTIGKPRRQLVFFCLGQGIYAHQCLLTIQQLWHDNQLTVVSLYNYLNLSHLRRFNC